MANHPPAELVLTPINGAGRPVRGWLTVFHLVFVALDPSHERSARIVPTAARVLATYKDADCRVAWMVTGMEDEARRFLGRWASEMLTFLDPDFEAVRAFGLGHLPAVVHLGMDGTVVNAVEGWDPPGWRALTLELSRITGWTHPQIPGLRDPAPFPGAPIPHL